MQEHWEELVKKLPPAMTMLGTVVQICTASFTKEEQIKEVEGYFKDRSTKGFDQGLAQSLDSIRAKSRWLERDTGDVEGWLKEEGYVGKEGGKL